MIGAIGASAGVLVPESAFAQESLALVRGRVVLAETPPTPSSPSADAAPLEGVRVTATSPVLTRRLETTTLAGGTFVLPHLPPGRYVIAFEREDLVVVRRTLDLAPLETRVLEPTVMYAAPDAQKSELIVTRMDGREPPRLPPGAQVFEPLDVRDGVPMPAGASTALAWAARPSGALPPQVRIDGAPVRLLDVSPASAGGDRPPWILDPGPTVTGSVTVAPAMVRPGAGLAPGGAAAIVTRPGGDRWNLGFDLLAGALPRDPAAVARSHQDENAASRLEATVGGPLVARRTWVRTGASLLRDSIVQPQPFGFSPTARGRMRSAIVTAQHAFDATHRLRGLVTGARRTDRGVVPVGATFAAGPAVMERRSTSDRLWSLEYDSLLSPRTAVTARVTHETASASRRPLDAAAPEFTGEVVPVIDQVAGMQAAATTGCATCDPERRRLWTARADLTAWTGAHLWRAGVEVSNGRIEPADAAPGLERRASRFDRDALGAAVPVFEDDGSAWLISRGVAPVVASGAQDWYVSDEWLAGRDLLVAAGVRGQHESLDLVGAPGRASRWALLPRAAVSWRSPTVRTWTLDAAVGRDLPDLLARTSPARLSLARATQVQPWTGPAAGATDAAVWPTALDLTSDLDASPVPAFGWDASRVLLPPIDAGVVTWWTAGVTPPELGAIRGRVDVRRQAWTEAAGDVRRTEIAVRVDRGFGVAGRLSARYTWSRETGSTFLPDRLGPRFAPWWTPADAAARPWLAAPGRASAGEPHLLQLLVRANLFADEDTGALSLDAAFAAASGRPYGATGWTLARDPGGALTPAPYTFTAADAFRTAAVTRTDVGVQYTRLVAGTMHGQLILRGEVLNLFDDAAVRDPALYTAAVTAFTHPDRFVPFDPDGTQPVRGVHWDLDPALSAALAAAPRTLGRAFRVRLTVLF